MEWVRSGPCFSLTEHMVRIRVYPRRGAPGCVIVASIGGRNFEEHHPFERDSENLLTRAVAFARELLANAITLLDAPRATPPERGAIRSVLLDYHLELALDRTRGPVDSFEDDYRAALRQLTDYADGDVLPVAWIDQASAPASSLIDAAYRSLRARALYYLLLATKPEQTDRMIEQTRGCLAEERARFEAVFEARATGSAVTLPLASSA